MRRRALPGGVIAAAVLGFVRPGRAAMPELHGASDAWAGEGLALAWGVLRGPDEERTRVVLRIESTGARHARLTATGRDPFGGAGVDIPVRREAPGVFVVDLPRRHFAEHPRTELRAWLDGAAEPALMVYFQGVPDTTPESTSAERLQTDLQARLTRVRAQRP